MSPLMAESATVMVAPVSPVATSRLDSKQAILADVTVLGLSRYLVFGLGFLVSIVQKTLLGPYLVGVWQLLAVTRQYLSYGDLGFSRGAEQKLPGLYASQAEDLEPYRAAAYTSSLLSVVVINTLILIGSWVWPWQVNPLLLWGFRAMAVIAMVESVANMMECSALRAQGRFHLLSVQILGSEGLFAVLSIPAILLWGVYGLLGAVLASVVFRLAFMRLRAHERVRLRWDPARAAALWRIGFPVTVFVVLFKTFDTLDRILLLHLRDLEVLGVYSIASMALIFLGHLPLAISQVFFPRTMTWTQRRGPDELARSLQQAQLCILAVMGLAVGCCYFVLPLIVREALPGFVGGIAPMKVSIFSMIFVGLVHLPIQYQIGLNRRWALVGITVAVAAAYYAIVVPWLFSLGTPEACMLLVAWARVAGYGVLCAVIGWWTWRTLGQTLARSGDLRGLVGIAVYLVLLIVGIDWVMPMRSQTLGGAMLHVLEQLALFGLGLWPVVRYVDRRTGVLRLLRGVVVAKG